MSYSTGSGVRYLLGFRNRHLRATGIFCLLLVIMRHAPAQPPTPVNVPALPPLANAAMDWADYDRDGDPDLFMAGTDSLGNPISYFLRNDGPTTFSRDSTSAPWVHHACAQWADYDNDTLPDLALIGQSGTREAVAIILHNDSAGNFSEVSLPVPGITTGALHWGDLDGDGDPDLFLCGFSYRDGLIARILQNNSSNFVAIIDSTFIPVSGASVDIADFDNDGSEDILITGKEADNAGSIRVYRNTGNLTFQEVDFGLPALEDGTAEWSDFDLDGDLDLLVSGHGPQMQAGVYEYAGGRYTRLNQSFTGIAYGDAKWGDYDMDSYPDIAICGRSQDTVLTRIYRNNQNGTFSLHSQASPIIGLYLARVSWQDYNNDSTLDLLVSGLDHLGIPRAYLYRFVSGSFGL